MLALLVAGAILIAAFLLGAEALALVRLLRPGEDALPPAERAAFALGVGVVLVSYVVLTLGLLGVLFRWAVWAAVAACGLAGLRQAPFLLEAARRLASALKRGLTTPGRRALRLFLAAWTLVVLLGALAPPSDSDYDGLSQHLASPKIYLRHHAITPLWFDHHSHFPSTLQMLFTVGLAAGSPEAAKVIHLACGLAAALVLIVIGRRFLSAAAGEWAAFALLTVPLVACLGTMAYVDLGSAFFAALLLLGFLHWERTRARPHLLLTALAVGGGMAVKMQGLQLLLVAGLLVLIAALAARERLGRALSQVAAFAAVAALVAAPWYAKSAVWTGNPVYPFAYSLFGGKYWSEAQAIPYQEHQLEFGVGSPPPPAERARLGLLARTFSGPRSPANLLLAPWNLVMRPTEFEVVGISPLYAVFATGIGPLFLALLPLLALSRSPRPLRWSLAFLAPSWLAWLMLMQYNRYLVPTLVFAALPVGHALAALPPSGLGRALPRVVAWTWGALALGYAVLGVWASGAWQVSLGLIGRQEYLEGRSECYRMAEWVNRVTPPDAKIALYSEPRGFYLDREYLWAEAGHSGLIDYAHIRSGADLQREFGRIGITDILYCRLPRAPDLFDLPPIGPALAELRAQGRAHVLGSPPGAPAYLLVAVDALSGAEQTSAGVGKGRR